MFDCVQLLHFFFKNLINQTFDLVRLVTPRFSHLVWNSSSSTLETNLPLPNNCSRAIEIGVKCLFSAKFSVIYSLILTHAIPIIWIPVQSTPINIPFLSNEFKTSIPQATNSGLGNGTFEE